LKHALKNNKNGTGFLCQTQNNFIKNRVEDENNNSTFFARAKYARTEF
jgi:hypothetical protein